MLEVFVPILSLRTTVSSVECPILSLYLNRSKFEARLNEDSIQNLKFNVKAAVEQEDFSSDLTKQIGSERSNLSEYVKRRRSAEQRKPREESMEDASVDRSIESGPYRKRKAQRVSSAKRIDNSITVRQIEKELSLAENRGDKAIFKKKKLPSRGIFEKKDCPVRVHETEGKVLETVESKTNKEINEALAARFSFGRRQMNDSKQNESNQETIKPPELKVYSKKRKLSLNKKPEEPASTPLEPKNIPSIQFDTIREVKGQVEIKEKVYKRQVSKGRRIDKQFKENTEINKRKPEIKHQAKEIENNREDGNYESKSKKECGSKEIEAVKEENTSREGSSEGVVTKLDFDKLEEENIFDSLLKRKDKKMVTISSYEDREEGIQDEFVVGGIQTQRDLRESIRSINKALERRNTEEARENRREESVETDSNARFECNYNELHKETEEKHKSLMESGKLVDKLCYSDRETGKIKEDDRLKLEELRVDSVESKESRGKRGDKEGGNEYEGRNIDSDRKVLETESEDRIGVSDFITTNEKEQETEKCRLSCEFEQKDKEIGFIEKYSGKTIKPREPLENEEQKKIKSEMEDKQRNVDLDSKTDLKEKEIKSDSNKDKEVSVEEKKEIQSKDKQKTTGGETRDKYLSGTRDKPELENPISSHQNNIELENSQTSGTYEVPFSMSESQVSSRPENKSESEDINSLRLSSAFTGFNQSSKNIRNKQNRSLGKELSFGVKQEEKQDFKEKRKEPVSTKTNVQRENYRVLEENNAKQSDTKEKTLKQEAKKEFSKPLVKEELASLISGNKSALTKGIESVLSLKEDEHNEQKTNPEEKLLNKDPSNFKEDEHNEIEIKTEKHSSKVREYKNKQVKNKLKEDLSEKDLSIEDKTEVKKEPVKESLFRSDKKSVDTKIEQDDKLSEEGEIENKRELSNKTKQEYKNEFKENIKIQEKAAENNGNTVQIKGEYREDNPDLNQISSKKQEITSRTENKSYSKTVKEDEPKEKVNIPCLTGETLKEDEIQSNNKVKSNMKERSYDRTDVAESSKLEEDSREIALNTDELRDDTAESKITIEKQVKTEKDRNIDGKTERISKKGDKDLENITNNAESSGKESNDRARQEIKLESLPGEETSINKREIKQNPKAKFKQSIQEENNQEISENEGNTVLNSYKAEIETKIPIKQEEKEETSNLNESKVIEGSKHGEEGNKEENASSTQKNKFVEIKEREEINEKSIDKHKGEEQIAGEISPTEKQTLIEQSKETEVKKTLEFKDCSVEEQSNSPQESKEVEVTTDKEEKSSKAFENRIEERTKDKTESDTKQGRETGEPTVKPEEIQFNHNEAENQSNLEDQTKREETNKISLLDAKTDKREETSEQESEAKSKVDKIKGNKENIEIQPNSRNKERTEKMEIYSLETKDQGEIAKNHAFNKKAPSEAAENKNELSDSTPLYSEQSLEASIYLEEQPITPKTPQEYTKVGLTPTKNNSDPLPIQSNPIEQKSNFTPNNLKNRLKQEEKQVLDSGKSVGTSSENDSIEGKNTNKVQFSLSNTSESPKKSIIKAKTHQRDTSTFKQSPPSKIPEKEETLKFTENQPSSERRPLALRKENVPAKDSPKLNLQSETPLFGPVRETEFGLVKLGSKEISNINEQSRVFSVSKGELSIVKGDESVCESPKPIRSELEVSSFTANFSPRAKPNETFQVEQTNLSLVQGTSKHESPVQHYNSHSRGENPVSPSSKHNSVDSRRTPAEDLDSHSSSVDQFSKDSLHDSNFISNKPSLLLNPSIFKPEPIKIIEAQLTPDNSTPLFTENKIDPSPLHKQPKLNEISDEGVDDEYKLHILDSLRGEIKNKAEKKLKKAKNTQSTGSLRNFMRGRMKNNDQVRKMKEALYMGTDSTKKGRKSPVCLETGKEDTDGIKVTNNMIVEETRSILNEEDLRLDLSPMENTANYRCFADNLKSTEERVDKWGYRTTPQPESSGREVVSTKIKPEVQKSKQKKKKPKKTHQMEIIEPKEVTGRNVFKGMKRRSRSTAEGIGNISFDKDSNISCETGVRQANQSMMHNYGERRFYPN